MSVSTSFGLADGWPVAHLLVLDELLVDFDRIDLELQVAFVENRLEHGAERGFEVGLAGTAARVRRHHARNCRVGAQQRAQI